MFLYYIYLYIDPNLYEDFYRQNHRRHCRIKILSRTLYEGYYVRVVCKDIYVHKLLKFLTMYKLTYKIYDEPSAKQYNKAQSQQQNKEEAA